MQIFQTEIFKKENAKIREFLENTTDSSAKDKVQKMYSDLISNIKRVDTFHQDLINLGKLPEDVNQIRNKITETRKKIFKIIDGN